EGGSDEHGEFPRGAGAAAGSPAGRVRVPPPREPPPSRQPNQVPSKKSSSRTSARRSAHAGQEGIRSSAKILVREALTWLLPGAAWDRQQSRRDRHSAPSGARSRGSVREAWSRGPLQPSVGTNGARLRSRPASERRRGMTSGRPAVLLL